MRPRLTIRVRLTLLYSALFAASGAVVVLITYGLVAASLSAKSPGSDNTVMPVDFKSNCREAVKDPAADPSLRTKCQRAFDEGVITGVQTQNDIVLGSLLRYSLTTLGAVLLVSTLAGWFAAGRVLRPVHRITAAARAASEHDLSARVSLTGPRDELRQLADTFDVMLERLEASFEGQRRFIANASHELRTPLTVMRATVDVVLAKPAPTTGELRRMGREVRAAVQDAEALIGALLALARTERGGTAREPADLATAAEDAVDAADPGDRHVTADYEPAPTTGDPILLERLAANLVDNAVRYNVAGGTVAIRTSTVDGFATLTVSNTGPRVPPAAVDGLFQPFRRLHDRTGNGGFGLGLAIVASIATAHGGAVTADALPAGGLRVTVRLPLS